MNWRSKKVKQVSDPTHRVESYKILLRNAASPLGFEGYISRVDLTGHGVSADPVAAKR
jgi:hypothetical protein